MVNNVDQYGISHLSVIPVRSEPSDKAEICTQLLFGDTFKICNYSDNNKWINIEIENDNYSGWIDFKQINLIDQIFYEEYRSTQHPLSKDLVSFITILDFTIPILFGSQLPFFNNGVIDLGFSTALYKGEVFKTPNLIEFKIIEKIAKCFLGSPYLWGGKTHFGIDCSGFVQQVFKFTGLFIPRDAYQQAGYGKSVEFVDTIPGDVLFFKNSKMRITHVGILIEDNKIIHASGKVRIDDIDAIGIFNKEKNIYTHKYQSAQRFFCRQ